MQGIMESAVFYHKCLIERPIQNLSRALNESERKFAATHKEALAIVYGVLNNVNII